MNTRWHFNLCTNYISYTKTNPYERLSCTQEQLDNFIEAGRKANKFDQRAISEQSIRKIRERAKWFMRVTKDQEYRNQETGNTLHYKLLFITLTLPAKQAHSNSKLKSDCLNNFLVYARKYFKMRSYIWRAELQHNGNIHFHLLTDAQMPRQQLTDAWNRILDREGYIARFETKFGHKRAPSTNIRIIVNSGQLSGYMSKYMSKIEDNQYIEGRHWSCSENVSRLANGSIVLSGEQLVILEYLVRMNKVKKFETDYMELYMIDIDMLADLIDPELQVQVTEVIDQNRLILLDTDQ